ncbi:hypothetical protein [Streptomyces sp. NPDC008139]|uniref:SCO2400 family protein n=1 Tax=Streptomyces sp. NPDC008139 TaxID=3364814 RepID=UPI0036E14BC3
MNYCHTCRRHLNGAFSCPGCGAIADRSGLPDEADTAQLPPVTEEAAAADGADPAPPAPAATPEAPAEGSLVDDLLRDSGLGPDAGPAPVPTAAVPTAAEPAAPVPTAAVPTAAVPTAAEPAAPVPTAPEPEPGGTGTGTGSAVGVGHGVGKDPDTDPGTAGDDSAYGGTYTAPSADPYVPAYGEAPHGDAPTALADSLLGAGGGGYREDHDLRGTARRRRGRHQRAAILGVGAVAVVGSLTMFGVAAFSGGSPSPSTDPGPGVSAISPSPDAARPSTGASGTPGVPKGGGRTSGSTSPSASDKASASPSASASRSESAPASSPAGKPSHTASASPSRTTAAPPTTTAPPSSPATPSPTCTHVLWWCQ